MTAAARTETPSTAVTTTERKHEKPGTAAERIDATRAALKERNQLVAAIRGTQWGKDANADVQRAVAHYCLENGLDPVRHVELLGGRIYLTAEFYDERGAPLIRAGVVRPDEPEFIHADDRLDKMAKDGDAWAIAEKEARLRARIDHAVPEGAKAAVVQRFRIEGGATILGVNWVGGSTKRDPVGDAEPTKTALTRARRRAWKQIADVIPGYGELVKPAEATARIMNESLPVSVVEASPPKALVTAGTNGYEETPRATESASRAVPSVPTVGDASDAPAEAPAACTRCGQPHRFDGGEDLGNAAGSCFKYTPAS